MYHSLESPSDSHKKKTLPPVKKKERPADEGFVFGVAERVFDSAPDEGGERFFQVPGQGGKATETQKKQKDLKPGDKDYDLDTLRDIFG